MVILASIHSVSIIMRYGEHTGKLQKLARQLVILIRHGF